MYDQAKTHAEPHVDFEAAYLRARVDQFRDQVARRIDGSLTEEEFRPLRLMNGLYLQLHAYMLRVAIPYGSLTPDQLRKLAWISETWDRGYGHFTTRQNIQFNWPQLTDVPDMLDALADVGMHAIQTSGATIRNVTADHFAGAAADEIEDPRPTAELIRQWSTDHPEFQFLPRKFKIAVTGAESDRAVTKVHDLGIRIVRNDAGETGYRIEIGGGLGRTPMIGQTLRDFLPKADLLPYLEAVVSAYSLLGRRDNKYKARIKITLHEHGIDRIRTLVEDRFAALKPVFAPVDPALVAGIDAGFTAPAFRSGDAAGFEAARATDPVFRAWADTNLAAHKRDDHAIATMQYRWMAEQGFSERGYRLRRRGRQRWDEFHQQNDAHPPAASYDVRSLAAIIVQLGLGAALLALAKRALKRRFDQAWSRLPRFPRRSTRPTASRQARMLWGNAFTGGFSGRSIHGRTSEDRKRAIRGRPTAVVLRHRFIR